MPMRSFFRKYKEELTFGYLVLATTLLVIIFLYALMMSAIAFDLADVIRERNYEVRAVEDQLIVYDLEY